MKVYLFRHGEVVNPDNILYGRLPGFHLSEAGKAGVSKSAEGLVNAGVRRIYTSPLERAVETSEIIRNTIGLQPEDVIVRRELIEVDCKSWEGAPLDKFLKETAYLSDPANQTATERILDAGKRVLGVMDELANQDENVVIVSHGDPITGALVAITKDWAEFHERYLDRGTFIGLEHINGGWVIKRESGL
jgi:broad specificity phosphatase PhoE